MRSLKDFKLTTIPWFWPTLALLILLRLALTADFAVPIVYSPHDDGLYVARAYHLLAGEGFGPYDARTLVKLPGISFWLAANRMLGIPYLISTNLLYIAAGVYFVVGALRCGFSKILLAVVFALYLLNPITFTAEWIRPIREPVSTSLLVVLLSSMIFILRSVREVRLPVAHLVVFCAVFAFTPLMREEDSLLYAVILLFAVALLWQAWVHGLLRGRPFWARCIALIALPLICASLAQVYARSFIDKHYGLPIIHDFGEGEFPKLIAAMRSVEAKKDNRLVMITQEGLAQLRAEVPRLAPVIDRLPQPSKTTYSCQRYQVCSEWANGWMLFWIKDAAYNAGLTPDLPHAQDFFRQARTDIEQACKEGRLKCRAKGSGLVPPFELRWTRAYVEEWLRLLHMTITPNIEVVSKLPSVFPVDADYGRVYQAVTMTHYFDTQLQARERQSTGLSHYENPLASFRQPIASGYLHFGFWFALAGLLALLIRLRLWRATPPSPFTYIATLFTIYAMARQAALAYAAVYFGFFDPRLIYSTYAVVVLLTPLLIADCMKTCLLYRARQPSSTPARHRTKTHMVAGQSIHSMDHRYSRAISK